MSDIKNHDPARLAGYITVTQALVEMARIDGFIITVENRPLLPLAQGHHAPHIEVYPVNARPVEPVAPAPYDVEAACAQAMERLTEWINDQAHYHSLELDWFFNKAVDEMYARYHRHFFDLSPAYRMREIAKQMARAYPKACSQKIEVNRKYMLRDGSTK